MCVLRGIWPSEPHPELILLWTELQKLCERDGGSDSYSCKQIRKPTVTVLNGQ